MPNIFGGGLGVLLFILVALFVVISASVRVVQEYERSGIF